MFPGVSVGPGYRRVMTQRTDGGEQIPERERLLGLVAGYVLEHGIADLTLRRLGTAIGSNNRMLLYYFGSKEKLSAQALLAASHRFPTFVAAMSGLDAPGPLAERLEACWGGIAAPVNRPFLRLFFEVFGVAAHQPGRFDEFLTQVGHDWTNQVAGYLRAEGLPARTPRRWPASSSRCGGACSSTCSRPATRRRWRPVMPSAPPRSSSAANASVPGRRGPGRPR